MALSEQDISGVITAERLRQFAPNIRDEIGTALARDCPSIFVAHEIDTVVHIAHFFAQVLRETGGLRRLDENMNYSSVERLKQIFRRCRDLSDAECQRYVNAPERLANFVYSGRNGNGDEASGDGWNYRGSGLIQLTGRGNFQAAGDQMGMNIVDDPDQVRSPDGCVAVAVGYWGSRDINSVAGQDSPAAVDRVTGLVNPHEDAAGKAERQRNYTKARGIFR